MPPIKIAYILTPIEFGGAERVSLNFLKNVDRSNFQVCPILLIRPWEGDNTFMQELKDENYPYLKISVAIRPLDQGRDYFRVIRCFKVLYSILEKSDFDLVHTNGYFADIIGIPVAMILGIPHMSTCHGFISTDRNLAIYNALDRIALRFSNRIIAVSDTIKHDLIKTGIKESCIKVIQNAVGGNSDRELLVKKRQQKRNQLNITEAEFVVGYVGRLSKEKGIRYLIEAISMLKKLHVPLKILIIGEGPQKKELEDLVKETGIEGRVIFAGFQGNVENWISAIDTFVLPSLTEGTPMSLLEAMAYGIPVVASAVGGVPHVIDSAKNGILVSPGKSGEIKDAIHILYKSDIIRNDISRAAQNTIKLRYNIKDWIRNIEAEYLKISKNNH